MDLLTLIALFRTSPVICAGTSFEIFEGGGKIKKFGQNLRQNFYFAQRNPTQIISLFCAFKRPKSSIIVLVLGLITQFAGFPKSERWAMGENS